MGPGCQVPEMKPREVLLTVRRGEVDPEFPLRGRLLGRGGSHLRQIQDRTRARVLLEFAAANPQDAGEAAHGEALLQIRIVEGRGGTGLEEAAEMVRELIRDTRRDHDQWLERRKAAAREESKCGAQANPRSRGDRNQVFQRHKAASMEEPKCGAQVGRRSRRGEQAKAAVTHCLTEAARLKAEALRLKAGVGEAVPAARLLDPEVTTTEVCESVAQRASAQYRSGKAFWKALEGQLQEKALSARQLRSRAEEVERRARMLEQQAEVLQACGQAGAAASSGADRQGGFCALFPMGACPFSGCCPRGLHGEPPAPAQQDVIVRITRAKKRLLQQKWASAGGRGELVNAWQVRNPRLEFLFRATEFAFAEALGRSSDVIDGWHGSAEENIHSIALHGFDPKRRDGQVFGSGEYFAKDPNVSISYARGGSFMFLCKLLLGKAELDHTWVDTAKYYVLKQRDCRIQALPLFLVQFALSTGALSRRLEASRAQDVDGDSVLVARQRGGLRPCEARRDAGMAASSTRHLWVGWLAPELCHSDDDAVAEDVEAFLAGHGVAQVVPERNGARIGAFVLLERPIGRSAFAELASRRYRGEFRISVDDQQPGNPRCQGKACPRLTGPSHYCRGWNLRGHLAWQWGCPFGHPEERRPTHGAAYSLERVPRGTAKFDEIETELLQSAPFFSADGSTGRPRIAAVRRVNNPALQRLYDERRGFLHDKHGFTVEKELWHGTNCRALPELLTHGLQPPSDTRPSEACPRSGGKGLCTTLCGASCPHCCEAHAWGHCHMYGLGVYLADLAQKSHRYVREPGASRDASPTDGGWQIILAGKWQSFGEEWQTAFDAAQASGMKVYSFRSRGWDYHVDFERMVQVNLSTRRERQVRRLDPSTKGAAAAEASPRMKGGRPMYSMLRCRVCLGNPYLIEGNLLKGDAMHDMCWCQDPSDLLESCAEPWGVAKGHDAFYVRGMAGAQKAGLGVFNSEYIVFQPFQILPLYQVDYVLE